MKSTKRRICFSSFLAVLIFSISSPAKASDSGDATPSRQAAQKAAYLHAEEVFSELLDSTTPVKILSTSEDANRYTFFMTAAGCKVEVFVSKETGMAFNDDPMVCEDEVSSSSNSDLIIETRKVRPRSAELVSTTDLPPKPDVAMGSKKFLIKINYCGYDKVTSPYFQNAKVESKKSVILGGTPSIYLEKTLDLVVDVKSRRGVGRLDICYNVSQNFEFVCPIRPGFEGAGCQVKINNDFVIYIENFQGGVHSMNSSQVQPSR